MRERQARPEDIVLGMRVRRTPPRGMQQVGLVVTQGGTPPGQVDVLPEGSADARPRTWPLTQLTVLPKQQQLPCHGGRFKPPKGYPFRITRLRK